MKLFYLLLKNILLVAIAVILSRNAYFNLDALPPFERFGVALFVCALVILRSKWHGHSLVFDWLLTFCGFAVSLAGSVLHYYFHSDSNQFQFAISAGMMPILIDILFHIIAEIIAVIIRRKRRK